MNAVAEIWSQTLASEFVSYSDSGGYLMQDVRDAAQALVALLQPGRGARRYMMGGQFLTWTEFAAALEEVTGLYRTPVRMTREDLEAQISESEAVDIALGVVPSDDAPLQRDSGVEWRPVEQTMRDTTLADHRRPSRATLGTPAPLSSDTLRMRR